MWTMALVKDGFHDLPNERFHTFAILKDKEVVGELKWNRGRMKVCGGPAWCGKLFGYCHGMDMVFHSNNKKEVLEWFKTAEKR